MSAISCHEPMCYFEIEFSCSCTSPPTYSCKNHLIKHCEFSEKTHSLKSMFSKPAEGTKEAVLSFLKSQKSKAYSTKTKILASFNQTLLSCIRSLEETLKEIDFNSIKIGNYFDKVRKAEKTSKLEKDSILSLLTLQPLEAIEKIKVILSKNNAAELFNKMERSINKAISRFNEEVLKIQIDNFLKLENPGLNSKNKVMQIALNQLKEDIRINRNNADAYNGIGLILFSKERYGEALQYYNDAIKINSNCAQYYLNKGGALRELGRCLDAVKCYKEAIKIEKNNANAYHCIGVIFHDQSHFETLNYYNDTIRINPNDAKCYLNKGNALAKSGRIEDALDCYKQANIIDPNNSSTCSVIGNIFFIKKKYEKALKYYNDAIRINPNCADFYINKGSALRYLERSKEAIECNKEAVRISKNNPDTCNCIGVMLYSEMRYGEAIEYFDDAIRISPNKAFYYENKGAALKALGRSGESFECFNEAHKILNTQKYLHG